jgi:hypothetical protein
MNVTLRYSRLLAVFMAILCGINLLLGVWLFLLTRNFNISIFLGIVLLVIVVGYWTRPYFHVEAGQVVVPALFGPLKRNFLYDKLRFEEGRLVAVNNGISKRIPIRRWLSHPGDWAQLEQMVK